MADRTPEDLGVSAAATQATATGATDLPELVAFDTPEGKKLRNLLHYVKGDDIRVEELANEYGIQLHVPAAAWDELYAAAGEKLSQQQAKQEAPKPA